MDRSYSPPKTGRRGFLAGFGAFLFPPGRTQATRGERDFRPPHAGAKPDLPPAPIRFREIAAGAGLDFVLHNNPTPRKHLIETMPGGVAAFDYNGDGLADIFFTNGAALPSLEKDRPQFHNRLYRNVGGMRFTHVTK